MFRKCLALLLLLFCLTGCDSEESVENNALKFRTKMMQVQQCRITANITADYGNKVYKFSVDSEITPEGTVLKILAPEEIAGISAVISDDGTRLEYEGISLEFGEMANGNIMPVASAQMLYECWTSAYISAVGKDGDLERVTYLRGYEDNQLTVDTWFDSQGIPVYGEVLYNNRRCLSVEIETFEC